MPAHPDEQIDPSDFDIVIVRQPSSWIEHHHRLTAYPDFVAIHADTLIYWESTLDDVADPDPDPVECRQADQLLDDLVRRTFEGYRNHYLANPLLDPRQALEGYVEWATATTRANGGYLALMDGADGAPIGFAVVDWSCEPPDVRLAGMAPHAQGQGRYRHLLTAVRRVATARGHHRLQISTQAHNINVQRVWAALGFKPVDALETTHLVRTSLLSGGRATTGDA